MSDVSKELQNQMKELRRPFPPESVHFKIQTSPRNGRALIVGYIDARNATERLDHCLPGLWSNEYEQVEGGVLCRITVGDISRCDVGWSQNTTQDKDLKTRYSDAFKRAAVKFGVGAFLYSLPTMYIDAEKLNQGKYLSAAAINELRGRYKRWLQQTGVEQFGEPLGHGDTEESAGPEEAQEEAQEPEAEASKGSVRGAQQQASEAASDKSEGSAGGSEQQPFATEQQQKAIYSLLKRLKPNEQEDQVIKSYEDWLGYPVALMSEKKAGDQIKALNEKMRESARKV